MLARAVTRGDGAKGDDITVNARVISSIPQQLKKKIPGTPDVRTEIYFERAEFERINEDRARQDLVLLSNPRNAATGTLKMLDRRVVAERPLTYFAHGIGFSDAANLPATHGDLLHFYAELGLRVNPHSKVVHGSDGMLGMVEKWDAKRAELGYDTDGLVMSIAATGSAILACVQRACGGRLRISSAPSKKKPCSRMSPGRSVAREP